MSKHKDQMSTPFHNAMRGDITMKADRDDVYDYNPCPQFSKPHDRGPHTIPVVFKEGELGHDYTGKPGKNAAVTSTMGGGVSKKS
jgi:hypothetical protein